MVVSSSQNAIHGYEIAKKTHLVGSAMSAFIIYDMAQFAFHVKIFQK